MKNPYLSASLLMGSALAANAASIAVNFSENDANQAWLDGASLIGPTNIPAAVFNNSNNPPGVAGLPVRSGTVAAGTLTGLVETTGATTAAAVSWTSANAWYTSVGTATDQAILGVGYLDDGGSGLSINITNIPYAQYIVYGLLASDQNAGTTTYTTSDFLLNGTGVLGGTVTAYRNIDDSTTGAGVPWSQVTSTQIGNYWVSDTQTAAALTITAGARSGTTRGSLAGFIIQQVPEPSSTLLSGAALAALTLRRRRA